MHHRLVSVPIHAVLSVPLSARSTFHLALTPSDWGLPCMIHALWGPGRVLALPGGALVSSCTRASLTRGFDL